MFAGVEIVVLEVGGGGGDGDVFEEDGDALNWFVTEWALGCGELEGVGDLVGEVAG